MARATKPSAPKKKKYKTSRAGRCEKACDDITDAAALFRSAGDDVDGLTADLNEPGDTITLPSTIFKDLPADFSDLTSPLEELQEEMQTWYDNLPESLQSGDKGDRLQEAASNLESAKDTIEQAEIPDIPGGDKEMTLEELEALRDALWEVADNLESGADEASSTDFPGMYG